MAESMPVTATLSEAGLFPDRYEFRDADEPVTAKTVTGEVAQTIIVTVVDSQGQTVEEARFKANARGLSKMAEWVLEASREYTALRRADLRSRKLNAQGVRPIRRTALVNLLDKHFDL